MNKPEGAPNERKGLVEYNDYIKELFKVIEKCEKLSKAVVREGRLFENLLK